MKLLILFCTLYIGSFITTPVICSDKTDEILFLVFLGIVADFAKILCSPEDISNAPKEMLPVLLLLRLYM